MIKPIVIAALASTLAVACSSQPGNSAGESGGGAVPGAPAAAVPGEPAAGAPAATAPGAPPATTSAAAPATQAAAAPSAAPVQEKPKFKEVTVPAGTTLSVKLETPLASDTSKPEALVKGTLDKPVMISGTTAVPAGSVLLGSVTEANGSGRVKGKASVAFTFDRLVVRNDEHRIRASAIRREAEASTKQDVRKGAVGAAAGAVVGGIAGGGTGAAIGAGVGGAGTVLATKGQEVRLEAGTTVSTTLSEAVTVLVPLD
jgi:hypothetical protein